MTILFVIYVDGLKRHISYKKRGSYILSPKCNPKRFKQKEHPKPQLKKCSLSTLKRANKPVGFCACGQTKGDKYEVGTILNTTVINNRVEHQLLTGNSSETSEERSLCCNTVRIALITNN